MEGGGGGGREIIYTYPYTVTTTENDSCINLIKMGSDVSHVNVSVGSDGQSHKTVSTNHNLFEEKGEPKRYRTEVLPLNALPLGHTGSQPTYRPAVGTSMFTGYCVIFGFSRT